MFYGIIFAKHNKYVSCKYDNLASVNGGVCVTVGDRVGVGDDFVCNIIWWILLKFEDLDDGAEEDNRVTGS